MICIREKQEEMDYVKYIREMVGKKKVILTAAAAIIVKDDKILLQRRSDNNAWSLVGGIMELDENFSQCAIREVKEETGLDVALDYLVGIYHHYDMEWVSGDKAHIICAVYKADIISGEPRIDEESLELRYFSKDEIPYIAADDQRHAVEEYIAGIRNHIE